MSGFLAGDRRLGNAEELHLWAVGSGASVAAIDVRPYEACRVVGIVERLRVCPVERIVEIDVFDGTAALHVRWSGATLPDIGGLQIGRAVAVEGVAIVDEEGRVVLCDPQVRAIAEIP